MDTLNFLNDKQKLFFWLYCPCDLPDSTNTNYLTILDKTIKKINELCIKYNINKNILLRKVIEYLYKTHHDKQFLIDKLIYYNLINNEQIPKILDLIEEIINLKSNELD